MKFKNIFKAIRSVSKEHDRGIFAGIAIAGVFCTGILTVRATKKIIEKKPEIDAAETVKEKAVIIGKEAVAPVAAAAVTTTAIVLEHHSGSKKIEKLTKTVAALKNAYEMSVAANEVYQAVVEEKTDSDLLKDIKKTFAKKMAEEQPAKPKEEPEPAPAVVTKIIDTGYGNELFCLNNIWFRNSKARVDRGFNNCDKRLYKGMEDEVSQGELYSEIDIGSARTEEDDEWVWRAGRDDIEPRYESYVSDKFNETVTMITFVDKPHFRSGSLLK